MLCKCLGIYHSVYYYHQTNSYKIANQKLDVEIKKIYDESKERYGTPKITKILNGKGINVSMESFNAILKVNVNNYETFEEAKLAIFEFIESWYNKKRIHIYAIKIVSVLSALTKCYRTIKLLCFFLQ